MCEYFSCIVTRDLKVHWSKRTMSHIDILQEITQEDRKVKDRDFVQIEIVPKDSKKFTRNPKDWIFKIDDERTIPDWYEKNVTAIQKACWAAWQESIKVNLILEKEEVNLTDTFVLAYGSSKAVLHDSSNAVLHDSSNAVLHDSSKAVLHDSSKAVLHDSSKAVLHDSSNAELYGLSNAELYGLSNAELYGLSNAELYGLSNAELYGLSNAVLHDSSNAVLHDSSNAVLYGLSNAVLKSELVTVVCHGKIYVTEKATVVRTSIVKGAEV